uniref:Uncharacterized protein n=1 Tax=Sphaerodactylus townsendi TaxID=933632 RepID=A0ACB8FH28_9SAUR
MGCSKRRKESGENTPPNSKQPKQPKIMDFFQVKISNRFERLAVNDSVTETETVIKPTTLGGTPASRKTMEEASYSHVTPKKDDKAENLESSTGKEINVNNNLDNLSTLMIVTVQYIYNELRCLNEKIDKIIAPLVTRREDKEKEELLARQESYQSKPIKRNNDPFFKNFKNGNTEKFSNLMLLPNKICLTVCKHRGDTPNWNNLHLARSHLKALLKDEHSSNCEEISDNQIIEDGLKASFSALPDQEQEEIIHRLESLQQELNNSRRLPLIPTQKQVTKNWDYNVLDTAPPTDLKEVPLVPSPTIHTSRTVQFIDWEINKWSNKVLPLNLTEVKAGKTWAQELNELAQSDTMGQVKTQMIEGEDKGGPLAATKAQPITVDRPAVPRKKLLDKNCDPAYTGEPQDLTAILHFHDRKETTGAAVQDLDLDKNGHPKAGRKGLGNGCIYNDADGTLDIISVD